MPRLPFKCARLALAALAFALALHAGAVKSNLHEQLMQVTVNGQPAGDFVPVVEVSGAGFLAPREFFLTARLRLPEGSPVRLNGRDYFPIGAIPGSRTSFDPTQQLLRVIVPASAFVATELNASGRPSTSPEVSGVGLFLNHDVEVTNDGTHTAASGLVEAGLFGSLGVFTSRFVARDLVAGRRVTRLETQFFHDFPNRMETLTIGDSVSSAAPWARQVYYGGFRWASKFSTQPGFIPQALPAVSGEAVLPSVVDIYADNVRRLSTTVQPGPFSINNVPVLSSQGTISMVVTDIMGRQQIITQSYSASPQLLRKGVQEFTYEGGALRHSYGIASSGYRGLFADATVRRGITDTITVNGRAELHPQGETAGGGIDFRLPFLIAGGGAAASQSHGRSGWLLYGELSHSTRTVGLSANYQAATADFRQLGLQPWEEPQVRQLQTSVSRSLSRHITFAAGYILRDARTNLDVRAVSASLNLAMRGAIVMFAFNRSLLNDHSVLFSMTLVRPVSGRTLVTESVRSTGGGPSSATEISRQVGISNGIGYRIAADTANNNLDAALSLQDGQGLSSIEVARTGGETGFRAGHTGGLVFLGGHFVPSRWLTGSFAVVEMPPEAKGVMVSANNQPIAKVGGSGLVLVPWLAPYEPNSIQVDPDALPIDLVVADNRKTVVPMPRSGLFVKFTPQRSSGATVRLLLRNGQPVPVGAEVLVNGAPGKFMVVLHGEVYLPDLQLPADLTVRWDGQSCTTHLPATATGVVLPRLGPFRCLSPTAPATWVAAQRPNNTDPEPIPLPAAALVQPAPLAAATPEIVAAAPYSPLPAPPPVPASVEPSGPKRFAVAVGALRSRESADLLSMRLRARHLPSRVIPLSDSDSLWRVVAGNEPSMERARILAHRLRGEFKGAFAVSLDNRGASHSREDAR